MGLRICATPLSSFLGSLFGTISHPLSSPAHLIMRFFIPMFHFVLYILTGGDEGIQEILGNIWWELVLE